MKHIKLFTAVILCTLLVASYGQSTVSSTRQTINFDFDWKFFEGDPTRAEITDFDDAGWRTVQVPHDWSIEGNFNPELTDGRRHAFLEGGIGWYRKHFEIPIDQKDKKIFLQFDGVYMRSDVYVNGQHVGFRPYGYVPFEYDITPYILPDESNVIAVRVDHSDCPTSRWYSGSGIYRHVKLCFTEPLHVAYRGTYVTTPEISDESATIAIQTRIINTYPEERSCELESIVMDQKGTIVGRGSSNEMIGPDSAHEFNQKIMINDPVRWNLDQPALYRLKTIVNSDNNLLDEYETTFGLREIRYDPDKGFFLNGKNMKMKGMNLHQDFGSLGTAVPDRVYEYRLEVLKDFGVNAIRCSHNPPSAEFLDMCDKMGFLVIDEAFDKWKSRYYAEYFDDWWQADLDAMLLRDRNHPSIVMWSVGNEVSEQSNEEGVKILKMLIDHVKQVDPTRPVTCAVRPEHGDRTYSEEFSALMDVVSYNYQEPYYEHDRAKHTDRIILGGESFPYFSGRFGDHRDYNPKNPWYDVVKHDYVIGQFIWAGIDYLGESSGWPSKGWPTGLVDVCGFLKPRSYFHRSVFSDEPLVGITVRDQSLDIDPGKDHWQWPHIASHWNFKEYTDHVILVETVTNCETVELILNGHSFGERKSVDYMNSTIKWYVPYETGTIEAIGRNNGKILTRDKLQTSGKPYRIELIPDREIIMANGQDVSLVKVSLVDEKGILVPDEDVSIDFKLAGKGKIIGIDSGDLRDNTPFKNLSRETFQGTALVIVQSERTPGEIKLSAKAESFPEEVVHIRSENPLKP